MDLEYEPSGLPTGGRYGNGLTERRTYDPDRGWIDSHTLMPPSGSTPLFEATYPGRDTTGRLTRSVTSTAGVPAAVTETFGYDELGRLTAHTTSRRPAPQPEVFEYDAIGRMTRSPSACGYRYDPAHPHAVTSTDAGHSRAYDPTGNLLAGTGPTGRKMQIDWTPTGMPHHIGNGTTAVSMAYDADGQRVRRGTITGTTYYFGRYLEQDGTGLTRYYWAGDRLIARRDGGGTVSYLLEDRLQSI